MLKNIGVIDSNSVVTMNHLNISEIMLGGKKFFEAILDQFDIFTPDYVKNNERSAIIDYESRFDVDIEESAYDNITIMQRSDFYNCYRVIQKITSDYKNIHEGEKWCLSLSLYLSRLNGTIVFLFSDDLKAINNGLKILFEQHKIGFVMNTLDFILHNYYRKDLWSTIQIRKCIQEYFQLHQIKDDGKMKSLYHGLLTNACRTIGLRYDLCNRSCYEL